MKFIKNNFKLFIGFLIGLILAGGIVYAVVSAGEIEYTTNKNANIKTVEDALNDLYLENLNSYKILETGTFTTASTSSDNYTYNTITLKNTYTAEQHAIMIVTSLVSNQYHVAPYMTMKLGNEDIVGNTKTFPVVNYGTNAGTMTFNYAVVSRPNT